MLLLGQTTDTQDTTGTVLTENHEKSLELDKEQVRQVILGFKGDYDQIPPMYSALKVDGKKLCDLARAGKEVERKARRVQILDISVEKIELPRVWMRVSCSKGTYIRTLCEDIGAKLQVGGCMESLLRTRVDRFLVKMCIRDRLEAMEVLEKEKNISKDTMIEAIENSLITACKNNFGKADNVKAVSYTHLWFRYKDARLISVGVIQHPLPGQYPA